MRTMTDSTTARYAAAAAALPAALVKEAMTLTDRMARHTDDAADALPYVLIALHGAQEEGAVLPVRTAVGVALRGAERDRARREVTAPRPSDLTALEDGGALTVARPEPSAPRLEDVLPSIPSDAAAMLSGIAERGLARLVADRIRSRRTLPNGAVVGDALDAPVPLTRRAFRVGDAAAAAGLPTPRTRAASDDIRAAGCIAWGHASVALGTAHRGEDVTARAVRAMRYITTDAAALGAAWRRDRDGVGGATADTATPDTLRRLGWQAPVSGDSATVLLPVPWTGALVLGTYSDGRAMTDPDTAGWWVALPATAVPQCECEGGTHAHTLLPRAVSGGALTRSMPEPRKGAAKRSRKGVSVPSASSRYAGGVSAGMAHGALVAGVGTDGGVTAVKRAARAAQREDVAAAAHAARAVAARDCGRPLPVPSTDAAHTGWSCGCGGSTAALVSVWVMGGDGTGAPQRSLTHALTPCPTPAGDGQTGHRCGCGRKRGALVRQGDVWAHRPR